MTRRCLAACAVALCVVALPAGALAQRALLEGGSSEQGRVELAFRLVTARKPTAKESAVLRVLLQKQLVSFRRDRNAALQLLSVGESPRNTKLDTAELAAWTMVASTILNLDETITRQ